jgi:hypothetical protein
MPILHLPNCNSLEQLNEGRMYVYRICTVTFPKEGQILMQMRLCRLTLEFELECSIRGMRIHKQDIFEVKVVATKTRITRYCLSL